MSHLRNQREGTYNDKGELVDLYIPRKCAATNKIIHAKDKSSVQLNIAEVDEETGRATGKKIIYGLSGFVRSIGRANAEVENLLTRDGVMPYSEN